jgi:hypothetical protein
MKGKWSCCDSQSTQYEHNCTKTKTVPDLVDLANQWKKKYPITCNYSYCKNPTYTTDSQTKLCYDHFLQGLKDHLPHEHLNNYYLKNNKKILYQQFLINDNNKKLFWTIMLCFYKTAMNFSLPLKTLIIKSTIILLICDTQHPTFKFDPNEEEKYYHNNPQIPKPFSLLNLPVSSVRETPKSTPPPLPVSLSLKN